MATVDLDNISEEVITFLTERHLATFTLLAPDGSPRVTPVGFTYEPERRLARVITWADSWKAKHIVSGHDPRVAADASGSAIGAAELSAAPAASRIGVDSVCTPLRRALLKATGRTGAEAEQMLRELGVDTEDRMDAAAKRALWARLRQLRGHRPA